MVNLFILLTDITFKKSLVINRFEVIFLQFTKWRLKKPYVHVQF